MGTLFLMTGIDAVWRRRPWTSQIGEGLCISGRGGGVSGLRGGAGGILGSIRL
jgi:hypothetical protein